MNKEDKIKIGEVKFSENISDIQVLGKSIDILIMLLKNKFEIKKADSLAFEIFVDKKNLKLSEWERLKTFGLSYLWFKYLLFKNKLKMRLRK
jgi:hypothetical protein